MVDSSARIAVEDVVMSEKERQHDMTIAAATEDMPAAMVNLESVKLDLRCCCLRIFMVKRMEWLARRLC